MTKQERQLVDYQILFHRLEESRMSKYDLILKTLFMPYKSQLRRILRLPDGEAHSIELDDWKTRIADAVILDPVEASHIEFQTDVQPEMPWRMLEYFWRIQARLSEEFANPIRLKQYLVHVGRGSGESMKPPLKSGDLKFSYEWRDLKLEGKEPDKALLMESDSPFDWILRVLCFEHVDHFVWEQVAVKIRGVLRRRERDSKIVAAYFVIAAILRRPKRCEEIIEMLHVKLDELPLIRTAIDRAEDTAARRSLARTLLRVLEKKGVPPESVANASFLMHLDEEALEKALVDAALATTSDEALNIVASVMADNGLSLR